METTKGWYWILQYQVLLWRRSTMLSRTIEYERLLLQGYYTFSTYQVQRTWLTYWQNLWVLRFSTGTSRMYCLAHAQLKGSIRKIPVLTCTQVFPRVSIAVRAIGCAYWVTRIKSWPGLRISKSPAHLVRVRECSRIVQHGSHHTVHLYVCISTVFM